MRFTNSHDGIQRANIRLVIRLTKDEVEDAKRLAKKSSRGNDWKDWLHDHAALGIEEALNEFDGSMEQRYGRGGD